MRGETTQEWEAATGWREEVEQVRRGGEGEGREEERYSQTKIGLFVLRIGMFIPV